MSADSPRPGGRGHEPVPGHSENSEVSRRVRTSATVKFTSLLAGAVAVILIGAWVFQRLAVPPPAPQKEVPVSELVQRDQRMHERDEDVPFTGIMFDLYPDGSVKSRSTLVDGVLHGVSEGWHTNGVLQVREHFELGVSHGVRTKWSADGRKLSEATIQNGKITGTFRRWHENGLIAEEIEMKEGNPHGLSRAYYADGSLKSQVLLEGGQVIERRGWNEGEQHGPLVPQAN